MISLTLNSDFLIFFKIGAQKQCKCSIPLCGNSLLSRIIYAKVNFDLVLINGMLKLLLIVDGVAIDESAGNENPADSESDKELDADVLSCCKDACCYVFSCSFSNVLNSVWDIFLECQATAKTHNLSL